MFGQRLKFMQDQINKHKAETGSSRDLSQHALAKAERG